MTPRLPGSRKPIHGESEDRQRLADGWEIHERAALTAGASLTYHQVNPATGAEVRIWAKLARRLRAERKGR